jgi:hypothetical protein
MYFSLHSQNPMFFSFYRAGIEFDPTSQKHDMLHSSVCKAKKRARRGRMASKPSAAAENAAAAADDQEAVRLGTTRQKAVKNLLRHSTKESWKLMVSHVSWSNGYRQSALSDQILACEFLWPGSSAPQSSVPNEQQEASSRMVPRHVAAMLSPSSSCSIFYVN